MEASKWVTTICPECATEKDMSNILPHVGRRGNFR